MTIAFGRYSASIVLNTQRNGWDTYNIGFRSRLTTDYGCSGYVERTLESAKRRLAWYRREVILKWVEDKWNARLRERLMDKNKEIMKL